MTSKRIFSNVLLVVVLSLAFTACKDDPQPAFEYKTQGFIKGKLTGVSANDNYTFNENFTYTQYSLIDGDPASTYQANSGGSYSLEIVRSDFNNSGSMSISLLLSNATDTTPDEAELAFTYQKELSDKFVNFYMESDPDNTTTITDFTFDVATGRAKGKYSLTGADNSTGKSASVTGEFDVITKRVVF